MTLVRGAGEHVPAPSATLADALRSQGRVVWALILREMQTRYGRSRMGYLWALVEPLILLGFFLLAYELMGKRKPPAGMEIVPFLATGIITFLALRNACQHVSSTIESNRGLLLFPQITPLDLLLGRSLLEIATFPVLFALIIGAAILLGYAGPPDDPLRVIAAMLAVMILGVTLGTLLGSITIIIPIIDRIQRPMWRVLMFTSCVFYTLNELPPSIGRIIAWNPIAHAIELLRSGYFDNYESHLANYGYLLSWVFGAGFFGLLLERMFRDRKKPT